MVYFLVSPETLEHHTPPGPGVAISLASVMYNNNSDDDVSLVRLGYSVIAWSFSTVYHVMFWDITIPCGILLQYAMEICNKFELKKMPHLDD